MILLKQQAENQRPIFAAIVLHTHCINWLALMQLPESSATQNSQTYVHLQTRKKHEDLKNWLALMQLPESSATQNSQTHVHLQNSKKKHEDLKEQDLP